MGRLLSKRRVQSQLRPCSSVGQARRVRAHASRQTWGGGKNFKSGEGNPPPIASAKATVPAVASASPAISASAGNPFVLKKKKPERKEAAAPSRGKKLLVRSTGGPKAPQKKKPPQPKRAPNPEDIAFELEQEYGTRMEAEPPGPRRSARIPTRRPPKRRRLALPRQSGKKKKAPRGPRPTRGAVVLLLPTNPCRPTRQPKSTKLGIGEVGFGAGGFFGARRPDGPGGPAVPGQKPPAHGRGWPAPLGESGPAQGSIRRVSRRTWEKMGARTFRRPRKTHYKTWGIAFV